MPREGFGGQGSRLESLAQDMILHWVSTGEPLKVSEQEESGRKGRLVCGMDV